MKGYKGIVFKGKQKKEFLKFIDWVNKLPNEFEHEGAVCTFRVYVMVNANMFTKYIEKMGFKIPPNIKDNPVPVNFVVSKNKKHRIKLEMVHALDEYFHISLWKEKVKK